MTERPVGWYRDRDHVRAHRFWDGRAWGPTTPSPDKPTQGDVREPAAQEYDGALDESDHRAWMKVHLKRRATDVHDLVGILSSFERLRHLDREVINSLVETGNVVRIQQGWNPVHHQEPADKAYVVLAGRLCVVRDGTEVAEIGVGELAGELGLIDHRLRNAQLTAEDAVRVLAWPRAVFQNLRETHHEFDAVVRASAASQR